MSEVSCGLRRPGSREIFPVPHLAPTGRSLPASALQYDALWLLGGAHPVTDRGASPWLHDELRLLAAFRRARRPVVGIGFGAAANFDFLAQVLLTHFTGS